MSFILFLLIRSSIMIDDFKKNEAHLSFIGCLRRQHIQPSYWTTLTITAAAARQSLSNKAPMSFLLFLFIRSLIMIDDSKKKEAHWSFITNFRGSLRSNFFSSAIESIVSKKSKGICPFEQIYFPMFIFTCTYLRYRIPHMCYFSNACIFTFWDTYFKIKEFISDEIFPYLSPYVRMLKGFFIFLHPTRT